MTRTYQIEDYDKIVFDGLQYVLPEGVLATISKLSLEIGECISVVAPFQPNTSTQDGKYKKPSFVNSTSNMKRSRSNFSKKPQLEDEWVTVRNFKATVIDKKEGLEKTINDVRTSLNKISNKNYDTQRQIVLEYIQSLEDDENYNTNLNRIITSIFDIASGNKFNSEIYADLYKEIITLYPSFKDAHNDYVESYKKSIREINYVDPNSNYDKFCEYNKINDRRKALSIFLVNLMKKEVLDRSVITNLTLELQQIVFQYIDEENRTNEVEEITENIFIFITLSNEYCKTNKGWENVVLNTKKVSEMKSKDKKSLSSRAVFKYMDVVDALKRSV
jgi:hypothetical protein